MKSRFFILILVFGIMASCNKDDDNETVDPIIGTWNLVNFSGGIAGFNCDYDIGTNVWAIDADQITITNTNIPVSLCGEPGVGTYDYSILESNGDMFLVMDGTEYGGITVTADEININQNNLSTGSGADGFQLRLTIQ